MTQITIGADKTIKTLLGLIIVLGGIVWGDLRFQATAAAERASVAAAMATDALVEIKNVLGDQSNRILDLERRVNRIEYGGKPPDLDGKYHPPFRGRAAGDRPQRPRGETMFGPRAIDRTTPQDEPAKPTPEPKPKGEPPDKWLETDG